MTNKKQTAVDFLEEQILLTSPSVYKLMKEANAFNHAKEMDKNNIINAAARGYLAMADKFNLEDAKEYGTEYYENTFNID
jgi:hypothetical protein